MERTSGPSLVSPRQHGSKPDGGARQRKKLQKGGGRLRAKPPVLPPPTPAGQPREASNRLETALAVAPRQVGRPPTAAHPSLPLPPDLSDSKWLEYIRKSGFLCAADSTQSKDSLNLPTSLMPEPSHLAIVSTSKGNQTTHHRPSFESDSTGVTTLSSHKSTMSSNLRRRAKTPVFSIGQLEAENTPLTRDALAANKTCSVELIAEQYKALIEHRDMDDLYPDCHSEPPPSRQGFRDDEPYLRRQLSSEDMHSDAFLQAQGRADPAALSPTSDDGTLVSFEEETVYFKPISFSPEPQTPTHMYSPGFGSPMTSPYNLSLQICLELLTRELSTAVSGTRHKTGTETAALQIWVMIEAYERLRDQAAEMRLSPGEASGVETMFDTWLMALYSIHDSLAAEARREVDEGDYEGLQEAVD